MTIRNITSYVVRHGDVPSSSTKVKETYVVGRSR